jgi:hypothetical protein
VRLMILTYPCGRLQPSSPPFPCAMPTWLLVNPVAFAPTARLQHSHDHHRLRPPSTSSLLPSPPSS